MSIVRIVIIPKTVIAIDKSLPPPVLVATSIALENTPANPAKLMKSITTPIINIGLVTLMGAISAEGMSGALRFAPQRLQ